ncbi:hypothetical protein V4C53_35625 [Paraburkholderia azotifigens]|uniref:hypothetical protein n=1 Tax=Paraburkholderia azotifigens TaxID=2057004 RepID=UPI0031771C7C
MAANKKPRRKYRPRAANVLSAFDAISRKLPMNNGQRLDLGIAYHVALDEMIHGRGTEVHWSTVVCALNIALLLAEQGYGANHLGIIKAALDGAVRSRKRAELIGRWGFDGDALVDVKIALETHDSQMAIVSQAEIRAVLSEMHKRIDNGNVLREAA